MKKSVLISIFIAMLSLSICWGQENKPESKYTLSEVLVSATKNESYQYETGSSTTVITADEIEKKGKRTVLELLRDVPGISVIQYGSLGGGTSIYLRGSKPGHTLVMIDGIELNDPMLTDRSFDFAHILTDNIERIEVVRGAQSTLYGSDAMGGVINIITKKGKGKPKLDLSFEGGSHNTFKETAGISGSLDKMSYNLSLQRLDSDGISKAVGGIEKDGYQNTTFSSRFGYEVSDDVDLNFVFRRIAAEYDYDDGGNQDDPNKVGWWDSTIGKMSLDQTINPVWDHKISFSYSKTKREYKDDPDSVDTAENSHNWYDADVKKLEWQHNIFAADWSETTLGFEYEEEEGLADGNAAWFKFEKKTMNNKGYYFQNQFQFAEVLFITPGMRLDDNEFFGNKTTYKISGSYLVTKTNSRLKANWGTGFKAPSLYQLNSPAYGDPTLKPDTGETYDIGFEQNILNDKGVLGLAYFHNEFDNMVEWDSTTWKYGNIDNAEMKGVEVECSFIVTTTVTIGANYTKTKTRDKDSGLELARRPKNQAALSIDWAFHEGGNLNLSSSYIGDRWDDVANTLRKDSYTKVDLSASYDLTKRLQVFGRIENLFDKEFQQVHGYAGSDTSFFGGIKTTF